MLLVLDYECMRCTRHISTAIAVETATNRVTICMRHYSIMWSERALNVIGIWLKIRVRDQDRCY